MSDYTTENTPKQTRQQCRHVHVSGHRCQSPCLRAAQSGHHEPFCYYHHTSRRPVPHRHSNHLQTAQPVNANGQIPFVLPHIEDQSSIQAAVNEIVLRITLGDLDSRRAGLLLYAMQTLAITLRADKSGTPASTRDREPEPEITTVEEVIDDPDHGLIAPVAIYQSPEDRDADRPSRWGALHRQLDAVIARKKAEREAAEEAAQQARKEAEEPTQQAPEPGPAILPTLQATAEHHGPTVPSVGNQNSGSSSTVPQGAGSSSTVPQGAGPSSTAPQGAGPSSTAPQGAGSSSTGHQGAGAPSLTVSSSRVGRKRLIRQHRRDKCALRGRRPLRGGWIASRGASVGREEIQHNHSPAIPQPPVIPISRHPVIPTSRHPVIPSSRHPDRSSGQLHRPLRSGGTPAFAFVPQRTPCQPTGGPTRSGSHGTKCPPRAQRARPAGQAVAFLFPIP